MSSCVCAMMCTSSSSGAPAGTAGHEEQVQTEESFQAMDVHVGLMVPWRLAGLITVPL